METTEGMQGSQGPGPCPVGEPGEQGMPWPSGHAKLYRFEYAVTLQGQRPESGQGGHFFEATTQAEAHAEATRVLGIASDHPIMMACCVGCEPVKEAAPLVPERIWELREQYAVAWEEFWGLDRLGAPMGSTGADTAARMERRDRAYGRYRALLGRLLAEDTEWVKAEEKKRGHTV